MTKKEFQDRLIENRRSMKKYAYYLTGNSQDANDLVQDTLLKALGSYKTYKESNKMSNWLNWMMKNIFLDQRRKEKDTYFFGGDKSAYDFEIDAIGNYLTVKNDGISVLNDEEFNKILDKYVTPYEKQYLYMSVNGYSYKEISEELNQPESFRFTIDRTKNRLREKIEEGKYYLDRVSTIKVEKPAEIINKLPMGFYNKNNPMPDSIKEEAINLVAKGKSFREVGRTIGVSYQSVMKWYKERELIQTNI